MFERYRRHITEFVKWVCQVGGEILSLFQLIQDCNLDKYPDFPI